ncbi:MAG TPA: VOC family protein [Methylovirgula sp.]|jgi:hypothetical protein
MDPFHGRFVWYELMSPDMAASRAFYGEVVGWTVRDASSFGMDYALFLAGDTPVAGLRFWPNEARPKDIPPYWLGYIRVDDVDVAAERFAQGGGEVHLPPTDIPNISRFSIVADPQKAVLALVKGAKQVNDLPADSGGIGHIGWRELLAEDWEKEFAFYNATFGWQKAEGALDARTNYQSFSDGHATVGGMFNKLDDVPTSIWLYYFHVRDIDASVKAVKARGGDVFYGPVALDAGGRIAHCRDSQGAYFGLLDRRRVIGFSTAKPV